MMDRNPPPMLACPLTPIHAPMPFLIDISSFLLREILSHFSWFKKGRSGQVDLPPEN